MPVESVKGQPRITALLCNWCSYAGADLAGISRFQYPPNLRIIRVMCSGRVDPMFLFEALEKGTDGVFVGACHLGDCHYQSGNYFAEIKLKWSTYLLECANLDPQRIRLEFISAAEGERFAGAVRDFIEYVSDIGPLTPEERYECGSLKAVASGFRVRWLMGIEREQLLNGNAYDEPVGPDEWNAFMEKMLYKRYLQHRILKAIHQEPLSAVDLASILPFPSHVLLNHLAELKRMGLVEVNPDHSKNIQRYQAVKSI